MPQVAESDGGLLPGDSHFSGRVWQLDMWKSQIHLCQVSIQVSNHVRLGQEAVSAKGHHPSV